MKRLEWNTVFPNICGRSSQLHEYVLLDNISKITKKKKKKKKELLSNDSYKSRYFEILFIRWVLLELIPNTSCHRIDPRSYFEGVRASGCGLRAVGCGQLVIFYFLSLILILTLL